MMLLRKTLITICLLLYSFPLCFSVSSILYETGYLQEYSSFRNVLPYMYSMPQDAKNARITFRSSHVPDSCDTRKVQIQLQYGSLPLGKNETFPVNYYLDRGDVQEVNIQSDNKTTHVDLTRPLPGDWFAIAYIPDKDTKLRPKGLFATCYYRLNVELTSTVLSNIDSIHLYHNYQVRISKPVIYRFNILETTSAYHVLVSGCTNATGIPVSCLVDLITRGQGVPDINHYDNKFICNDTDQCIITVPVLYQYGHQYVMFTSSDDITFTFNISTSKCESQDLTSSMLNDSCIMYPLMDRQESQTVFKTKYMYIRNGTIVDKPYILSENSTLIVPYEIKSGIDNGGSVVLKVIVLADPKVKDVDVKILVRACLHRTMPERSGNSECPPSAAQLSVNSSTSVVLQDSVIVPYPKAGTWFTTLSMSCFISDTNTSVIAVSCGNRTVNVSLDIQSDRCVEGRCNDKGSCAVYLQGRLLVSTCVCQGGWSGYACNDGSDLIPGHEQLTELILLTVSHVMFIPAVILALYRTHYVEAFVYFYTMFFSAFYHACDGGRSDEYKYCIINLSVLSFCDFLGSVTSIWVTLIAMTKLPRTIRSVLYTAGPLLIAMGIELERTSLYMFVVPGALGALFIAISWARKCYGRRKCYPPCKRYLLCLLPGLLIAGGGLCIFAFAENNQNYKYTHSVWHMLMATCTMFLLPPKPKKREPLFGSNEGGRQCLSSCLADDPNSTPLTSFRDTESLENLII
ncbi:post-GPI attachment to proteins factor 6-like isoform X1 [Mytilus galloprovincialis]|uniref:post-GPI attachment to proteins factor 6-like isoform X1 n=1 Tax=Mytilus galloprovincialis TaxID=29158 RepID=UPI003F7BB6B3